MAAPGRRSPAPERCGSRDRGGGEGPAGWGQRGWEIHMESEKLYYFTINILGQKKKTLPIPSGKCSMLIDKL